MKPRLKKIMRFTSWTVLGLVICLLLWIAPLAYPNPLFDHSEQVGTLTFHCDSELDPEMLSVVRDVERRIRAVGIYDPQIELDVFLCRSEGLYRFFARLTLVPTEVPGFNISQAHNSFLSLTGIEQRHQITGGFPGYSAIGGDLAHVIAHELVHNYAVAKTGFFATQELPPWKTEGYAEYAASLAARGIDSSATLRQRIKLMQYSFYHDRPREYYSWSLVVEYLSAIQGRSYQEIMADSRPFEQMYDQMMVWYEESDAVI